MTVAECLTELGPAAEVGSAEFNRAKATFRRLAQQFHPDHNPGDAASAESFRNVLTAWERWRGSSVDLFSITLAGETYTAEHELGVGNASSVYAGRGSHGFVTIQVQNEAKDYDLLKNAHDRLKSLWAVSLQGPVTYMLPSPRGIGVADGRGILVCDAYQGQLTPLRKVREAFPDGIDAADMLWIWRRCLTLLDFLQANAIVHGSLNPDHLLLDLPDHGLHVCGWTSAVKECETPRVMDREWGSVAAPEAQAKSAVTRAADMYDVGFHMKALLGTRWDASPPHIKSALSGCLKASARHRVDNAAWLFGHLDDLIDRIYGGRKFRPLVLPKGT